MHATRLFKLVGTLVAAGLIVAACGGGGRQTEPTQPPAVTAPGATARPTNTSAPPPTATPIPVPTGSIKISLASVLTYGLLPGVSISMNRSATEALYDAIVGINQDYKLDEKLGLVSSWTSSADGMSWTLKTREGVTFHDGTKATSKDIKVSNDWYSAKDGQYGTDRNFRTALVKEIQLPDESTAVLVLNNFYLYAVWDLFSLNTGEGGPNFLISGDYLQKVGFKEYNKNPIGSGPYKFKSDIVSQEVNYEAVDRHWLYGVPRHKSLQVLIVKEDNTRVALLKAGSVEATEIPRIEASNFKKAGYTIAGKLESKNAWLSFTGQWVEKFNNGVRNPFYDPRVRVAFSYAVDREEIIDKIMYGLASPTMEKDVPPGDPAFRAHPITKKDLAKAKQLLTEAGYPNCFEMNMNVSSGGGPGLTTEGPLINEATIGYYQALGCKVNRVPPPANQILRANSIAADYTLPTAGGPGWGSTIGHFKGLAPGQRYKDILSRKTEDPQLEQLALRVGAAKSMSEYIDAAQKYQDFALEMMIEIPLFVSGEIYAAKTSVAGEKWNLGRSTFMYNFAGLAAGKPDLVR